MLTDLKMTILETINSMSVHDEYNLKPVRGRISQLYVEIATFLIIMMFWSLIKWKHTYSYLESTLEIFRWE